MPVKLSRVQFTWVEVLYFGSKNSASASGFTPSAACGQQQMDRGYTGSKQ